MHRVTLWRLAVSLILAVITVNSVAAKDKSTVSQVELQFVGSSLAVCNTDVQGVKFTCKEQEFFPLLNNDASLDDGAVLFWRKSGTCAVFQHISAGTNVAFTYTGGQHVEAVKLAEQSSFYGHCLAILSKNSLQPHIGTLPDPDRPIPQSQIPEYPGLCSPACTGVETIEWLKPVVFRLTSSQECFYVTLPENVAFATWEGDKLFVGKNGTVKACADTVFYLLS